MNCRGVSTKIIILITIAFAILTSCTPVADHDETLTVGAILPLHGQASIWGESIRNGMEIAQDDLARQGTHIDIIYEDSSAQASKGISAYHKLSKAENIDVVISAFSSVSKPLIPLAHQDKTPLLMTAVAADNVANASPYAYRYFSNTRQFAETHFHGPLTNRSNIAVLYRNDEYGVSVKKRIEKTAAEKNITIVRESTFKPGTQDFRTHLLKIRESPAQAIVFVGAVPPEVVNALRQARELELKMDFFDASLVLSGKAVRNKVNYSQDTYTLALPFTLEQTGHVFRDTYVQEYNKTPFFAASLGYDMIQLLHHVRDETANQITTLRHFNGTNGHVRITSAGEINPTTVSARVANDTLIPVG